METIPSPAFPGTFRIEPESVLLCPTDSIRLSVSICIGPSRLIDNKHEQVSRADEFAVVLPSVR